VLVEQGFNTNTVEMVQLMNWMADMNAQGIDFNNIPNFAQVKKLTNMLHFDGLYNTKQVEKSVATIFRNIKASIDLVCKTKGAPVSLDDFNPVKPFVADMNFQLSFILGLSLHVLQDLYTHSNFMDALGTPPSDGKCVYYAETFVPKRPVSNINPATQLMTGFSGAMGDSFIKNEALAQKMFAKFGALRPHGSYTDDHNYKKLPGLNHDSASRPDFDRGYVDAFAQTQAFVKTFLSWIETAGCSSGNDFKKYDFASSFREIGSRSVIMNKGKKVDTVKEAERQIDLVHKGNNLAFAVSAYVTGKSKAANAKVDGYVSILFDTSECVKTSSRNIHLI
jgi:hypothetical protein